MSKVTQTLDSLFARQSGYSKQFRPQPEGMPVEVVLLLLLPLASALHSCFGSRSFFWLLLFALIPPFFLNPTPLSYSLLLFLAPPLYSFHVFQAPAPRFYSLPINFVLTITPAYVSTSSVTG